MKPTTFKLLRTVHRWSGLLFAPLILLFAVSGLLQTLQVEKWALPDWALSVIYVLQDAHQDQQLRGWTHLRHWAAWIIAAMAAALAVSTLIGIVMAYKMYPKRWWLTTLLLVIGLIVPLLALLV
ncbi:MAG: hypothetical protein IT445_16150 [Phycisphaeraceae bacterium]|nr:hypothetical protein [Phycisphaeraceae bacterium]